MTKSRGTDPSNPDSTHDLLAGWNIEAPDGVDEPSRSSPPLDMAHEAPRVDPSSGHSAGIAREHPSGGSLDVFPGFVLEQSRAEVSTGLEAFAGEGYSRISGKRAQVLEGTETVRRRMSGGVRNSRHTASRSRSPASLLHPGDEVAGFRILRELGRGAFARVYLAEEIHLGRRLVAIKVSRPEGEEPQVLARLQHTHIVPVHSVCDDPKSGLRVLCMPYFGGANLAQVLDAAGGLDQTDHHGRSLVEALDLLSQHVSPHAGSGSFVVTPQPQGAGPEGPSSLPVRMAGSLSSGKLESSLAVSRFRGLFYRLVGTSTAMPKPPSRAFREDQHQPARQFLSGASAIQAAVWIVARLAEGLDHAHSRGLLHRDIKPANILLAADGTPMLLDFNLAAENRPEPSEGEIRRALVGGTLPYMAPEHLDAFNPRGTTSPESVDERADIYALGLILFEMLADEPPFPPPAPGATVLETLATLTESRRCAPSLRARCPQLPWSLDALVAKCLEFQPDRRYARARDLAEDLRRFLDDRPMKHCPEPSFRERMGKFARRHPGLCGATSIALLSLVLLAAMGTAVVLAIGLVKDLAVRFQRQRFDRDFTQMQFLLNTASASDEHLAKGVAKARDCFIDLGLRDDGPAHLSGWILGLSSDEQHRVREQAVELILLEARSQVLQAKKRGSEADRRRAIERAIARLDHAESLDDHAPAALFDERARYYDALGEPARADRDRLRAAQTAPATCHDWTLLGTTLLAAGNAPGAEDALRRAIHLDVTSFWSWFILGHCHYQQGRFLEAAGDFAVCSARGSSFAWAHFNRGLALARAGRLLDAKDAYDRALHLESNFIEAMVDRALVELELNQLDEALYDLNRAVDLGRKDLGVLASRGETLARLGRQSEAERDFADLLARHPDDPVVRVARGMTRVHTDPPGAQSDFGRVLEGNSRNAVAHYGMALLIRGTDPQSALRHLDTALDTDPHLIDAIQLRALVRARLGDRAALDDVDRLLASPTSGRLYNAACAVSLHAEKTSDTRQLPHALELLNRALEAGFPASEMALDPDLRPLQALPEFHDMLARARQN
jgi:serine/threonine protein kinase/tetratricopeptide (TPR) repeat protein